MTIERLASCPNGACWVVGSSLGPDQPAQAQRDLQAAAWACEALGLATLFSNLGPSHTPTCLAHTHLSLPRHQGPKATEIQQRGANSQPLYNRRRGHGGFIGLGWGRLGGQAGLCMVGGAGAGWRREDWGH